METAVTPRVDFILLCTDAADDAHDLRSTRRRPCLPLHHVHQAPRRRLRVCGAGTAVQDALRLVLVEDADCDRGVRGLRVRNEGRPTPPSRAGRQAGGMGVSIAVVGASACRNGGERVPASFTKPRLGWERKRASRAPILATRTPMRAHGEHGTDACHLSCNACAACHLSCNACAACSLSCNAVTCPATLVPPLRQINSAALNDGHVKLSTYLDQETITSLLAAAESQASKRANAGNDDTMEYSSHAMMKKQAVRRATHRVVVPCCSGRLG